MAHFSNALKAVTHKLFNKYLLITNCASVAILQAAGDAIEQRRSALVTKGDSVKKHNWERTGHMFWSGIPVGVVGHFFYDWLDRRFPGTAHRKVAAKLVVDTVIGTPVMNIPFFLSIDLMEGKSLKDGIYNSVVKLPPIFVADVIFWLPVQAVNFYFLPPQFRVIYLGVANMVWTSFLSYVQYEYKKDTKRIDPKAET